MAPQLDEPIEIVSYRPIWPQLFIEEAALLRSALRDLAQAIEHIGSTAVPGMAAKPVVDIQIASEDPDKAALGIRGLGYEDLGEAGVPGRRYLRKRSAQSFNAHVVEPGGPLCRDNLLLRDYLRSHPAEAQAYAAHKRALFEKGATCLLEYSSGKSTFIAGLLERAR